MRIAQVAPLFERVPPVSYGGTERVVHHLTEALVRAGHEVTLFASGDSLTSARLVAARARALRLDGADDVESIAAHALLYERLAQHVEAGEFDLVHLHCDPTAWPLVRRLPVPTVTTLHGRLDAPGLARLFDEFIDVPLVSISDAQRQPCPSAPWAATVHHGLPVDLYRPGSGRGGYLAFLGRLSPEKRVDRAIEIAEQVGMPLKIAAKIDRKDSEYFEEVAAPLLERPGVEYVGELGDAAKGDFLGNASALLFPIDWPEPFGLVMIEALACGTPVIAFARGSVPEIVRDGVTGFVVDSVPEAVQAVECLGRLSREDCRRDFEQRFTAERMAEDYLVTYGRLLARARPAEPVRAQPSSDLAIA